MIDLTNKKFKFNDSFYYKGFKILYSCYVWPTSIVLGQDIIFIIGDSECLSISSDSPILWGSNFLPRFIKRRRVKKLIIEKVDWDYFNEDPFPAPKYTTRTMLL